MIPNRQTARTVNVAALETILESTREQDVLDNLDNHTADLVRDEVTAIISERNRKPGSGLPEPFNFWLSSHNRPKLTSAFKAAHGAENWPRVLLLAAMLDLHDKLWNGEKVAPIAAKSSTKKKPAERSAKKLTPKPAAKKPAKKPAAAFMALLHPSPALARVIGAGPMMRTDVTSKIWAYIKKHGLQDKKNARIINTNTDLAAVLAGKPQVSMFEMTKMVSAHLASTAAKAATLPAAKASPAPKAAPLPRIEPLIKPLIRPMESRPLLAKKPQAAQKAAPAPNSRAAEKLAEKRKACLADLRTAIAKFGDNVTRAEYAGMKPKTGRSYETAFGGWTEFLAALKTESIEQVNTVDGLDTLKTQVAPKDAPAKFLTSFKHELNDIPPALDPAHEIAFKSGTEWSVVIRAYPLPDGAWAWGTVSNIPELGSVVEQPNKLRTQLSREEAISEACRNETQELAEEDISAAHLDTLKAYKAWLQRFIDAPAEALAEYHGKQSSLPLAA